MNIVYVDQSGNFQYTDNSTLVHMYDMFQRMITFLGEQSFNAANGVDYFGVFSRSSFLKPQIEAIQAQYSQYFISITNDYINLPESETVKTTIVLPDGSVQNLSAVIGG